MRAEFSRLRGLHTLSREPHVHALAATLDACLDLAERRLKTAERLT
jgi:hypothetical protein